MRNIRNIVLQSLQTDYTIGLVVDSNWETYRIKLMLWQQLEDLGDFYVRN